MGENPGIPMVTPYMYHYFIDALMQNGLEEQAVRCLKDYWGGMLREGADTFWELYDPKDRYASLAWCATAPCCCPWTRR